MSVQARLREARIAAGFASAEKAAAHIGISESTYRSHEGGRRAAGRLLEDCIRRYAEAFGVSYQWLAVGTGDGPAVAFINPMDALCAEYGSERKLAEALGISQVAVNKARKCDRISAAMAGRIERTSEGRWKAWEMRPDIFPRPGGDSATAAPHEEPRSGRSVMVRLDEMPEDQFSLVCSMIQNIKGVDRIEEASNVIMIPKDHVISKLKLVTHRKQ